MVWKKNFVSVILWAAYFLGISAALMYDSYEVAVASSLLGADTALFVSLGSLGGMVLLFILCRLLAKRLPAGWLSGDSEMTGIIEGVLFIALITAGVFLRIVNLDSAGESAAYYDIARVTENGEIMEVTHGATFFYVYLLRILFLVVGNKWIAGIWLQMVLQFVAAILLYVAVRRIAGVIPGLILLGMTMLLPTEIMRGLTYTPHMFYLCMYAIGLLGVAAFLDRQARGIRRFWSDALLLLFCGAWVGMVCYLDVTGLTLLMPVLYAFHVNKMRNAWSETIWSVLTIVVLAVLFFIGFICADAFLCDKNVLNILYAWAEIFYPKARDMWFWCGENAQTSLIVHGIMVFGALGFCVSGKVQRFSLWITMFFILCVMAYFHIPVENMDVEMMLLIIGSILGGVGIRECILGGKVWDAKEDCLRDEDNDEDKEVTSIDSSDIEQTEEIVQTENREEALQMEETSKQVKYIENPLPLPKKHVKKVLDYSVQPQEEFMHYDIEVTEDDDFDL